MSPAEVCAKAAELIREHGWVQGRFGDKRSGYCLDGALNLAYSGHPRSCNTPIGVRKLVGGIIGRNHVRWNDDPLRTVEEVLAVLDEASRT